MKDKEQDVFAEAAAHMHKLVPVLVKTGIQDRAQLERLYPQGSTAEQLVTSANKRVLTDDGEQCIGSTTERQGEVAAAIEARALETLGRLVISGVREALKPDEAKAHQKPTGDGHFLLIQDERHLDSRADQGEEE